MKSKRPGKGKGAGLRRELTRMLSTVLVIPLVGTLIAAVSSAGPSGVFGVLNTVTSRVTGAVAGFAELLPSAHATESGTGTASPDPSSLTVAQSGTMQNYSRARFGSAWTDDVDVEGGRNGCDTRNDILARDLTGITTSDGCKVLTGTLVDPYTGRIIEFERGQNTSALVQIDHLVALGNAWVSGGESLPSTTLKMIANDPLNLLAVDGSANASKRDYAADRWLPPYLSFRCSYVKRQVMVKNKYKLTITAAEKAVMDSYYGRC